MNNLKGAGIIIIKENYINNEKRSGQTFILVSVGKNKYSDWLQLCCC